MIAWQWCYALLITLQYIYLAAVLHFDPEEVVDRDLDRW